MTYQAEEMVKGRLLKVRAQFENIFFVFLCVYAPTTATGRMVFRTTLDKVLCSCDSEEMLFLGGDFNWTELTIDRNHVEPHMPSRRRLIEVMHSNDLVAMWRHFHNEQKRYTWVHSYNNLLLLARLDRFYSFKHQRSLFRNCAIVPVGFSDHSLVVCSLSKKCLLAYCNVTLNCTGLNVSLISSWNHITVSCNHSNPVNCVVGCPLLETLPYLLKAFLLSARLIAIAYRIAYWGMKLQVNRPQRLTMPEHRHFKTFVSLEEVKSPPLVTLKGGVYLIGCWAHISTTSHQNHGLNL